MVTAVVFPQPGLAIRLLDKFVSCFPRRLFTLLRPRVTAKFSVHPLLLVRSLAGTEATLPAGSQLQLLNSALLAAMISHPEAPEPEVYRKRLRQGDFCYCLVVDGELVAFQWIARHECSIYRGFEQEVVFMKLTPTQAYTYDFYTYQRYRCKGYGSLLKQNVFKALRETGISELFSGVMHYNRVSLHIQLRAGFRLWALPYTYRIMDWSWTAQASERRFRAVEAWLQRQRENAMSKRV